MRKKIIAGNWKMNKTPAEARELVSLLKDKVNTSESDVVFCVPSIDIPIVVQELKGSEIAVGAQNVYFEDKGAFTGEISADMLCELGVKYVIIGHSERRAYFGETDETVNKKTIKALEKGLVPIVCVGESLEERQDNIAFELIRIQVKKALKSIPSESAEKVVIAYEPIWAIGTGKTATSEQAQEVCKAIRDVLSEIYDRQTADKIRIQYGGSVNAGNAGELFSMPDIDGGLVGGASLKADFEGIVKYR
jgi:triosephosphate isomerase